MFLEIITPERTLFKGDIKLVRVPGTKGSFAMLSGHAPIISTLECGIIRIVGYDKKTYFELMQPAVLEQHDDKVIILADSIQEAVPIHYLR